MKKKVLFMIINMNIGGTEKALLNMISEIPEDEYDITILMLEKYGGFLKSIPEQVHVESLIGYRRIKKLLMLPPKKVVLQFIKKGHLIKLVNFLFFMLISRITKEKSTYYKYLCRYVAEIPMTYDLAVAYAGPMDFISFFVAKKIKAKMKAQWIHFDVRKIGFNKYFANRIYKYFNKIFVVSNEGKVVLSDILPTFKNKIKYFPNIISREYILKMAKEGKGFDDNFTGFRILTVGRLSREKGQDLTIPVLARLKQDGYNVRWYCIGDGNARMEYEKMIDEYCLQNDYLLLGANSNPYPFMKQCDIYVQPSRHEGYCITLAEAKCFGTPIVTTHFTGAAEQIIHERCGLIVDFDDYQLYLAIKRIIIDDILRNTFKNNLLNEQANVGGNGRKLFEAIDKII